MVNGKKLLASILVGAMVITGSPVAPAWNVASVEAANAKTTVAISTGGVNIYNDVITGSDSANVSVTRDSAITLSANADVKTADLVNYESDLKVDYVWAIGSQIQIGSNFRYLASENVTEKKVTLKLNVSYTDKSGKTVSATLKEVEVTINVVPRALKTTDIKAPSFDVVCVAKKSTNVGTALESALNTQIAADNEAKKYGTWTVETANLTKDSTKVTAKFTTKTVSGYTVDSSDKDWKSNGTGQYYFKKELPITVKVVDEVAEAPTIVDNTDDTLVTVPIELVNGSTSASHKKEVTLRAIGTNATGFVWTVDPGVNCEIFTVGTVKDNYIKITTTAGSKEDITVKVQPENGNISASATIRVKQYVSEAEAFAGISLADVVYDTAKSVNKDAGNCYWTEPKNNNNGSYDITNIENRSFNTATGKFQTSNATNIAGEKVITVEYTVDTEDANGVKLVGGPYTKKFIVNVAKKEITPKFGDLVNEDGNYSDETKLSEIVHVEDESTVVYKWFKLSAKNEWIEVTNSESEKLKAGANASNYKLVAKAPQDPDNFAIAANATKEKTYNFKIGKKAAVKGVVVKANGEEKTYVQSTTSVVLRANHTALDSNFTDKYQWYKDGVAINGATEESYTVNNTEQSGVYYCVLTPDVNDSVTPDVFNQYEVAPVTSNKTEVSIVKTKIDFTSANSANIDDLVEGEYGTAFTKVVRVATGTNNIKTISSWSYEIKDLKGNVVYTDSRNTSSISGTIDLTATVPATLDAGNYKIVYTVNYDVTDNGKTVAQTSKSDAFPLAVKRCSLIVSDGNVKVANITYGDAVSTAKVTYVDDANKATAEVINQNVTFTINDTTTPKAGPYTIASGKIAYKLNKDAEKNYSLSVGTVGIGKLITVDKKLVTVTADDVTIEDGKDIDVILTSKQDVEAAKTTVTYKVTDKDGKEVDLKNIGVGTYTVTPVVKLADIDNYNVAVKSGTLTVTEHKHDFEEEVITKATTTTEGVVKKTCKICGKVVVEKTAKLPKKAQSITIKTLYKPYKVAAVKKASKTFSIGATCTSKKTVTVKKVSGSKKIKVSKTGKVTIAKGTKKGTYTAKVRLYAPATSSYNSKTIDKVVKVKVK